MIVNLLIVICSYFVGGILGGKVIQYFYKVDISKKGSHNIGARNAGRVLGIVAFILVLLVDFSKGYLFILLLKFLDKDHALIFICVLMLILGHIKPILNRFKGGKGVATFIGAVSAISPNMLLILILIVLVVLIVTQSITIGFYGSIPVLIYINYLEDGSIITGLIFVIIVIIIYFIGISDIDKALKEYFK